MKFHRLRTLALSLRIPARLRNFIIHTSYFIILLAAARADDTEVVVDAPTAQVLHGSLKWLAAQQLPNGAWTEVRGGGHPVAMTGYTLLAYMGSGNLPDEGEFAKNVTNGMQFLLDSVQPDGLFANASDKYMYQHGIATTALAELYGQTRSPAIRLQLDRLVKTILNSQSKQGGWRYNPRPADADISVTVLHVVALRAAKNAGLDVPQTVIDNAIQFVRSCYNVQEGAFSYLPGGKGPGFARTAAAIYSLQVCGIYDDPEIKSGSSYLFQKFKDRQYWTYGNYYAAPAQYMIGGDTWRHWYPLVRKDLLDAVKKEGDLYHWENRGGGDVGPVYDTAVASNILAIPYHYLPLYQR